MNSETKKGYKGFLLIRCEHCGKVKAFCAYEEITEFYCIDCGRTTLLEKLKKLWVHCECGKRFRYKTNQTEKMFDIDCLRCGYPVAIYWNGRKRVYETIKYPEKGW